MSYEDLADLLGEDTFDYVEDTFLEADDLAEHAVPSPPHIIDEDDFDIDLWQYDYWMDIDYGSDGDEIRHRQRISRRTRKRKLNALNTARSGKTSSARRVSPSKSKRRKVLPLKRAARGPTGKVGSLDQLPPVVMMKHAILQRYEPQETRTLDVKPLPSSSLLSNWREQFKDAPMWERKRPVVELEHVEDAPDDDGDGEGLSISGEDVTDDVRALLAAGGEGEDGADEEWEDEVEDDDEEEEEEEGGEGMELDPEALKMAIQQNLAAAGINIKGLDQEMLMSMAMQMFSGGRGGGGAGGEASDAMLGQMTDMLLGGRKKGGEEEGEDEDEEMTEDEDSGFKDWVTKQAEEKAAARKKEEEANKTDKDKDKDKADLPTPASSHGKPSQSPPDKRALQPQPQHQQEEDASAGAGAESRGTKRKAETVVEVDVGELNANRPKKSARARFDAPTAASKARSVSGGAQAAEPAKRKGRK